MTPCIYVVRLLKVNTTVTLHNRAYYTKSLYISHITNIEFEYQKYKSVSKHKMTTVCVINKSVYSSPRLLQKFTKKKSILSDQTLTTKDYRVYLATNYRVMYHFFYFSTTRALRNLSPRGREQQRNGEDYIRRKFVICTAHRI